MNVTNQQQDLSIVVECLERVRSAWLRLATISVGLTVLLAGVWRLRGEPGPGTIGLGVAALASSVVALVFLFRNLRVTSSPFYRALREHPERIVWVYLSITRKTLLGLTLSTGHSIRLHLDDGRVAELPSVPGELLEPMFEEVTATIVARAPNAVFGYRDDVARQYREDPKLLALASPRS